MLLKDNNCSVFASKTRIIKLHGTTLVLGASPLTTCFELASNKSFRFLKLRLGEKVSSLLK